jgi:hypothetical protein
LKKRINADSVKQFWEQFCLAHSSTRQYLGAMPWCHALA